MGEELIDLHRLGPSLLLQRGLNLGLNVEIKFNRAVIGHLVARKARKDDGRRRGGEAASVVPQRGPQAWGDVGPKALLNAGTGECSERDFHSFVNTRSINKISPFTDNYPLNCCKKPPFLGQSDH